MAGFGTKFSHERQDWETPLSLFQPLDDEFHFTLDVCATEQNRKCENYYSLQDNALYKDWNGTCWMNPPFGNQKVWVKKAYEESLKGNTIVCLLPCRTNTTWWHNYCMKGEIRFILGRPKFVGAKYGLPQPLAFVIFKGKNE